jgi:hypothetical protein
MRTLGWVLLVLLGPVVLVEMLVLAVRAAFVAYPLAAVPVAVVVVALALIVWTARRANT